MDTVTIESIPIAVGREEDGRWWADIESIPGVMAYGETRESAIAAVRALALRVAADCMDHGEQVIEFRSPPTCASGCRSSFDL
jgi:predicted RNase H-like HicB family nuclease